VDLVHDLLQSLGIVEFILLNDFLAFEDIGVQVSKLSFQFDLFSFKVRDRRVESLQACFVQIFLLFQLSKYLALCVSVFGINQNSWRTSSPSR